MSEDFKLSSSSGDASSSAFASKHKDVFAFQEVKLKRGDEPRAEERSSSGGQGVGGVDARDFKGRESLFRESEASAFWEERDDRKRRKVEEEEKEVDKFAAFRHRGDRFKRPHAPQHRGGRGGGRGGGRVPDFRRNPQKYTKYSLEDVDLLDNASNSQAAFSFLREMDERKRKEGGQEEEHDLSSSTGKITFKKPTKNKEGAVASSSKRGRLDISTKKGGSSKDRATMRLSHLMGDDEEEEEDE